MYWVRYYAGIVKNVLAARRECMSNIPFVANQTSAPETQPAPAWPECSQPHPRHQINRTPAIRR